MRKKNLWASAALVALAFVTLASPASATIIISTVGGQPLSGAIYENFDTCALGAAPCATGSGIGVFFTPDGKVVNGPISGVAAPPVLSSGNGALFGPQPDGVDATNYLNTGLGTVSLGLPGLEKYLGLLWGSVDLYNTLQLYDGATLVDTITGSNIFAAANGDQGVSGTFYVNLLSNVPFDSAVLSSSQYSFEADNVAFYRTNPVPEPSSLALFGAGLFGLVMLGRKKRKGVEAITA